MIRIALCGHISFEHDHVEQAVAHFAAEQVDEQVITSPFSNPTDLIDICTSTDAEEQLFDLVISAFVLPGINGMQLATELSETLPVEQVPRFILCAPDASRAHEASARGIFGYLVEPASEADLLPIVARALHEIAEEHASSAILRCRDGFRRIRFSRLSYVETSGRNQVLHSGVSDMSTSVRCSSRAMFAYLEHDERFYKLGSSYIVNLDYVASLSLRSGMVTMLDGIQIPAPVRLRKPLAEAICAHALVSV